MTQDLMNQQTTAVIDPTTQRPANLDYILLDGSGSMHSKWDASLRAITEYISGIEDRTMRLIGTQFDHSWNSGPRFQTFFDGPVSAWENPYISPLGGGTPLYDAINMMGRQYHEINPIRSGAIIVTDGAEADSKTSLNDAKRILDWMRAKGWQVTFIGCDFNNSAQASLLGGDKSAAIGVSQARLSDAAKALAKKRNLHAQFGAPMHWSDADHEQFGGYLGHSK